MSIQPQSFRLETDDGVVLRGLRHAAGANDPGPSTPIVVLLHGGGANARWWDHLAPRLAERRSVYALDFRGHGDSEYPQHREVGAFGLDLEAMVGWLGREDVQIVGHSLGAAVALDHASRYAATRRIALIDLARGSARKSSRRARLALSLRRTYRTREEAVERFRFLPESSRASEALHAHIAQHSVHREADGRYGYKFDPAWFGLPSKPRPDLANVRCPTLLVRGGDSSLLAPDAARAFADELGDGRLVEIPDAGHQVLLDQPDRLFEVLDDFLE